MKKRILSLLMTAVMVFSVFSSVVMSTNAEEAGKNIYRDDSNYLIQKISNPTTVSGEADGLVAGADRENSYAWSMQEMDDEYGDYIYIGSNRNILYASLSSLVNTGGMDQTMMKSLVDVITNGEIETNTTQLSFAQAVIVRYNVKTQTMETYFDAADYGFTGSYALVSGFRAAMMFKGDIYFNANGVGQSMIWRISDNNQEVPEVVYSQPGGYMRAMTISSDGETMYVGGTDIDDQGVVGGKTKINVCATTNGTDYELIADYRDFVQYEQEGYFGSGGDVWDIVEYNGSLYFTLMTNHGAIVYEAHKATEAEQDIANEYGWVWTDIVGETENSIYEPGFGNVLNYAASPYVYNGDLYFITFSNAMDSIIYGAAGLLSMAGSDEPDMQTFFNSLKMMDQNFDNETSVFRMTSDGTVQMVVGDSEKCPDNIECVAKLGAGFNDADYSTTQYNWRAAVYGGKLYIGTFDSYAMSKYVTKLTNGDLFEMDDDEFRQQLEYAITFLKLISGESVSTYSLRRDAAKEAAMEEIELAAEIYNMLSNEAAPILYAEEVEETPEVTVEEDAIDQLVDALVYIYSNMDGEATTEAVSAILNSIQVQEGAVKEMSEGLEQIIAYLNEVNESVEDEYMQQAIDALTTVVGYFDSVLNIFENVDQEGVDCYVRVSDTIAANDNPGFELYCTEDGVNYETITLDGFNDEYNYGCRTLLVGSDGLYLGTANPFFGGQLWKINEKTVSVGSFVSNIDAINEAFDKTVTEYRAEVGYDVDEFTFTFVPADLGNTIYLNGTALEKWDGQVALAVGENVICVVNENIDGTESTEYIFTIVRAEEKQSEDTGNTGTEDTNQDNQDQQNTNNTEGENQNGILTGDASSVVLFAVLAIVSAGLILVVAKRKRA